MVADFRRLSHCLAAAGEPSAQPRSVAAATMAPRGYTKPGAPPVVPRIEAARAMQKERANKRWRELKGTISEDVGGTYSAAAVHPEAVQLL